MKKIILIVVAMILCLAMTGCQTTSQSSSGELKINNSPIKLTSVNSEKNSAIFNVSKDKMTFAQTDGDALSGSEYEEYSYENCIYRFNGNTMVSFADNEPELSIDKTYSEDELIKVVKEVIGLYVDDEAQFEQKSVDRQPYGENTSYFFTYERKIDGYNTADTISVGVLNNGLITDIVAVHAGMFNKIQHISNFDISKAEKAFKDYIEKKEKSTYSLVDSECNLYIKDDTMYYQMAYKKNDKIEYFDYKVCSVSDITKK